MHEVRCAVGHEPDYVIAHDLAVHGLSDVLFNSSQVESFFRVNCLTFTDEDLTELVCHVHLELQENLEEVLAQIGEVLFFEQLRVNLRQAVEFGVHLVLGNRTLVAN